MCWERGWEWGRHFEIVRIRHARNHVRFPADSTDPPPPPHAFMGNLLVESSDVAEYARAFRVWHRVVTAMHM